MTFNSPWWALFAAAVSVPLLLLLYFLKLRRQSQRLSSTLLWVKSVEDLQVNTPFQRLRASLLLVLQMLMLLALLLALSEPRIDASDGAAARVIVIIDRSASMQATDGPNGVSRFDAARASALDLADAVGRAGGPEEMLLITFARSATVLTGFERDRRVLRDALETIVPLDEEGHLGEAFKLANAFSMTSDEAAGPPPDVVLFSDGGVSEVVRGDALTVRAAAVRYVAVGPSDAATTQNVGVASFSARRDLEDPTQVVVFARLVNASSAPVSTIALLQVRPLDDAPTTEFPQAVTIPAATVGAAGEAVLTWRTPLSGGAVVSVRHRRPDPLALDDLAAAVLREPAGLRIAYVHPGDGGDPFLLSVFEDAEPASLRLMTPEQFDALDVRALDSGSLYDLVVFDRVAATRLPGTPSLTVGALPGGIEVTAPSTSGARPALSWSRDAPVMQYVSLDGLRWRDFGGMVLPAGALALASGPDGPVMVLLRARGTSHVVVGFDLVKSNWPRDVGFAIFMQNVLDIIAGGRIGDEAQARVPGVPITARMRPDASVATVSGPVSASRPGQPGALVTLPTLSRVGLYTVDGVMPPEDRLAVSLVSDVESDTRPRPDLVINADLTRSGVGAPSRPRELWPWCLAAALLLLVVEWLVYCTRARGM